VVGLPLWCFLRRQREEKVSAAAGLGFHPNPATEPLDNPGPRAINFPHSARAELGGDGIGADGSANHLLTGTRRRSSSKKFSRRIARLCD